MRYLLEKTFRAAPLFYIFLFFYTFVLRKNDADMPLNIPSKLPAVEILKSENIFVMDSSRASTQDIRPLRIIILNLMPLKITTETDLIRLLSNTPLQLEIDFLKIAGHVSKNTPVEHMIAFYKEFSEVARQLLETMHNRNELLGVIASKDDAVFISIGKENTRSEMVDTSVVVTKYHIGDQNQGAIGVIGPVRMDYARIIPHLQYFAQTLGKVLAETFEQEQ